MNKTFTQFFEACGMAVDGNKAYGVFKGYETNGLIAMLDNISPFRLHISFYATDEQKRQMQSALFDAKIKNLNFMFTQYGLLVGLNDITVKRLMARLSAELDVIYGIIADNGALGCGYCPVCGNAIDPTNAKGHNIDGFTVTLDDDCLHNINDVISAENKEFEEAPNNYFKGFWGALLGGLVGMAISVLLYLVGFVSSLSAVVSVMLGAFLFQKFGGKANAVMIVIVSVTTVVCMASSVFLIYIGAAAIAANQANANVGAIEAFSRLMQNADFSREFYIDLVLSLVFSALGVFLQIATLARKIRRNKNIM